MTNRPTSTRAARAARILAATGIVAGTTLLPGQAYADPAPTYTATDAFTLDHCFCVYLPYAALADRSQTEDADLPPSAEVSYWTNVAISRPANIYLSEGSTGNLEPYTAPYLQKVSTRTVCGVSTPNLVPPPENPDPDVPQYEPYVPLAYGIYDVRYEYFHRWIPSDTGGYERATPGAPNDPFHNLPFTFVLEANRAIDEYSNETPPKDLGPDFSFAQNVNGDQYPVPFTFTAETGSRSWPYTTGSLPDGVDEAEFEVFSFAAIDEAANMSAPFEAGCANGGPLVRPELNSCMTMVVQRIFVVRASVLVEDAASSTDGSAVDIDVLANDKVSSAAGGVLTDVKNGSHGTAQLVDGKVRYTPDAGFSGTDTVTYTVLDERTGKTVTATITISVTAAPVTDPATDPTPATDTAPTTPAPTQAPTVTTATNAPVPSTSGTTPKASGRGPLATTGAAVAGWGALAGGLLVAGFAALRAGRRPRS